MILIIWLKEMSETTTIQISKETHERLLKQGVKGETFDDIIVNLLNEGKHLVTLKSALAVAIEKVEITKKDSRIGWPAVEAADKAIAVLSEFIEAVEKR